LYFFYKNCSKAIHSLVLEASAKDSMNDIYSTGGVFVSTLIYRLFDINLDGYMGLIIAVLILLSGISIIKEAANKILGEAPDADFVASIEEKINAYEGVYGSHDLLIHSYGPHRLFASAHVEVDRRVDVLTSHDLIDKIERDFLDDGIHLVIHLDPIDIDNPRLNQLREEIIHCVSNLSSEIKIHDFRAVLGNTRSKLIFDCMIPYSCKISQQEIEKTIQEMLSTHDHQYDLLITFERPYNG
ncbi:MAG: cation diffusion facilitator family transporter, partial [Traorella sp.]